MKADSLYLNEFEVYTDEANVLEEKARLFLGPLIEDMGARGFSLRDTSHILMTLVRDLEAVAVLRRNTAEYRKQHPKLKFKNGVHPHV